MKFTWWYHISFYFIGVTFSCFACGWFEALPTCYICHYAKWPMIWKFLWEKLLRADYCMNRLCSEHCNALTTNWTFSSFFFFSAYCSPIFAGSHHYQPSVLQRNWYDFSTSFLLALIVWLRNISALESSYWEIATIAFAAFQSLA